MHNITAHMCSTRSYTSKYVISYHSDKERAARQVLIIRLVNSSIELEKDILFHKDVHICVLLECFLLLNYRNNYFKKKDSELYINPKREEYCGNGWKRKVSK